MTKVELLSKLMSKMIYEESNLSEYLADDILKIFEEKIGTKGMAEMITKHPNAGYTVRYIDDFAPKMINEIHQLNIKKAERDIIELLNS